MADTDPLVARDASDLTAEADAAVGMVEYGVVELGVFALGLLIAAWVIIHIADWWPAWRRGVLSVASRHLRWLDFGLLLLAFIVVPILLSSVIGGFLTALPGVDFDMVEDPGGNEELGFLMGMTLFQQGCLLVATFLIPAVRQRWLRPSVNAASELAAGLPPPPLASSPFRDPGTPLLNISGWCRVFGCGNQTLFNVAILSVLFLLLALPLVMGSLFLVDLLYTGLGIEYQAQEQVQFMANSEALWLQALMVTVAVFGAPLAEELIFRGVLLPLLLRRFGVMTAIVLNGVVFGVIHMHLPTILPLSLLGMLLAASYLYSRDIRVPIGIHLLFNALNTAMLLGG